LVLHADVVPDHELRQLEAADQDDTSLHPLGVVVRIRGEAARRGEDAPVGLRTLKCADELPNFGPSDGSVLRVALRLDVDAIRTPLLGFELKWLNFLSHCRVEIWTRCAAAARYR
jgi:hypothetical protein